MEDEGRLDVVVLPVFSNFGDISSTVNPFVMSCSAPPFIKRCFIDLKKKKPSFC